MIIAATAAAVVVVVGGLVLASQDDADEPRAVEDTTTTAAREAPATPEEVARGFAEAYDAHDAEAAAAFLTDGALADLGGSLGLTAEDFPRWMEYLDAIGAQDLDTECEEQGDAGAVRCTFVTHQYRSDEIGLGPYGGNSWEFTVRDGVITSVSLNRGYLTNGMSGEMWFPFTSWLATEHPADASVMLNDSTQLSEESIRLWEQRTREYVEAYNRGET
ncbi:MAG: hypothetical protein ABWZ90_09020 [Acidimicrobiales bacterium]